MFQSNKFQNPVECNGAQSDWYAKKENVSRWCKFFLEIKEVDLYSLLKILQVMPQL